jgi:hypothetical protein
MLFAELAARVGHEQLARIEVMVCAREREHLGQGRVELGIV